MPWRDGGVGCHPEKHEAWTPALFRLYLVHVKVRPRANGEPLSPTSAAGMAGTLHSCCASLHREALVERDPLSRLTPPREPRMVKPTIHPAEIANLLDAARAAPRDHLPDATVLL